MFSLVATINGKSFPASKPSSWLNCYIYTMQLATLYHTHSADSAQMRVDVAITDLTTGEVAATFNNITKWSYARPVAP